MGCLKKTQGMPLDVILEILIWLPAKSTLRFKSVCKEWCNLIKSPFFAKLHLNKSQKHDSGHNQALFGTRPFFVDDLYHPSKWTKLNWPKDTIRDNDVRNLVGSCNGLVCFNCFPSCIDKTTCGNTLRCFLICNPTTRTFKLVLPFLDKKWSLRTSSYGFGYDSDHDDYKIVVTGSVRTKSHHDVCIYSLKADLWSCPTSPTRVLSGRTWRNGRRTPVFMHNMLHYLLSTKIEHDGHVTFDYRIARFDVASEKWTNDLNFPVQPKKSIRFGGLDGWLYLHDVYSNDVWIMEGYGSWKMMFRLPQHLVWHKIIARSKDGHSRLLFQYYLGYENSLVWYDHRHNTTVPFELEATACHGSGTPLKLCIIASLIEIPGRSSTNLQEINE